MGHISISYVGDLQLETNDSTHIVDNSTSYVMACRAIESALKNTSPVEFYVRKRNYYAWLQSFMALIRYDADFSEKTARDLLAYKWHTTVPDWVSDADILSQKLLDVDIGSRAGKPFEHIILGALVDPVFETESLLQENAGPIIVRLIDAATTVVRQTYPIIENCLKEIAQHWRNNASDEWESHICDCIPEKIDSAWRWITASTLLNSYPKALLDRILPIDQAAITRKIPPHVGTQTRFEPDTREEALTQIKLFLDEISPQISSVSDFRKLLEWVSGYFPEEFQRVEAILRKGVIEPEEKDIILVQEKFQHCLGIERSKLNSLLYIIRPAYPSLLKDDAVWDAEHWIQWTVDEYIPYREWQIRNNMYDEKLEKMVGRFSDWYIDSYMSVQGNADYGLPYALRSMNMLKSKEILAVILIIDCLPLNFASILENALRESGFHRHQLSNRFSALPTVTEYNKGTLITGKLGVPEHGYNDLLMGRVRNDWGGRESYYVSTVKELAELRIHSDSAIVLVNFNDGDEILHSDVESKNRTYEEELSRSFSSLVRSLKSLCDNWSGKHDDVTIIVTTDHGACRILEEEQQSFDSTVIQKLFIDEKHRMAMMTEEQAQKVPANLWKFGYKFKTPLSADDAVHFLPRGHNTVRKIGKKNTYMHGGVSPEEVIVPFSQYGLEAVSWKKLFTRFVNLDMNPTGDRARFYIQRTVTVEIEVQNQNTIPVSIKAIEALAPEAAVKGNSLGKIEPEEKSVVAIDLYFQKEAVDAKELTLRIIYEISGEEISQTISVPSEFKSAMSGGFNLRDLTNT